LTSAYGSPARPCFRTSGTVPSSFQAYAFVPPVDGSALSLLPTPGCRSCFSSSLSFTSVWSPACPRAVASRLNRVYAVYLLPYMRITTTALRDAAARVSLCFVVWAATCCLSLRIGRGRRATSQYDASPLRHCVSPLNFSAALLNLVFSLARSQATCSSRSSCTRFSSMTVLVTLFRS